LQKAVFEILINTQYKKENPQSANRKIGGNISRKKVNITLPNLPAKVLMGSLYPGRSPDLGIILLTRLPIPSVLGQWHAEFWFSITVAGQWRYFTVLPDTRIMKKDC
jgi:hypothetical protein